MKLLKRSPMSQSTLELIVLTVLVIAAIAVMGPYVVRSINAYMRSWERQATEGELGVDTSSLPWFDEAGPIITCDHVNCSELSRKVCENDDFAVDCCIWLEKFQDKIGQPCTKVFEGCVARSTLCQPNSDASYFCCGGPPGLVPPPQGGAGDTWCQDKRGCYPWDCSRCDEDPITGVGECNFKCRDVGVGSDYIGEPCECPDCMPPHIDGKINPYSSQTAWCDCSWDGTVDSPGCNNCPRCHCGDGYCRWTEREVGDCDQDCDCGECYGTYETGGGFQCVDTVDFSANLNIFCSEDANFYDPCCDPNYTYEFGCFGHHSNEDWEACQNQQLSCMTNQNGETVSNFTLSPCTLNVIEPDTHSCALDFDDDEEGCDEQHGCTWYTQHCQDHEDLPDCNFITQEECCDHSHCMWNVVQSGIVPCDMHSFCSLKDESNCPDFEGCECCHSTCENVSGDVISCGEQWI